MQPEEKQEKQERRIATLREEVNHLAAGVSEVRRTLWRTFGVLAGIGGVVAAAVTPYGAGLCLGIMLGAISAGVFALLLAGLAELLIGGCRAQLRRRLEELPLEERRAVLLPVAHQASGDAWRIVSPLSDELNRALPRKRSELAPAPLPDGRGDEPAATDQRSSPS